MATVHRPKKNRPWAIGLSNVVSGGVATGCSASMDSMVFLSSV